MGDYIKREVVIQEFEDTNYDVVQRDGNDGFSFSTVVRVLHEVPAADVAPVVHGKWIVVQTFKDCVYANCNNCDVMQTFYHNKPLTKFCPNCGAKMDL